LRFFDPFFLSVVPVETEIRDSVVEAAQPLVWKNRSNNATARCHVIAPTLAREPMLALGSEKERSIKTQQRSVT
jgi:hypothetical protein